MARKRRRATKAPAMVCEQSECGPRCVFLGLIAALLFAAGLFLLVGGVMKQMAGMSWTQAGLWYFLGFVVWCIGKCCKAKACAKCA